MWMWNFMVEDFLARDEIAEIVSLRQLEAGQRKLLIIGKRNNDQRKKKEVKYLSLKKQ